MSKLALAFVSLLFLIGSPAGAAGTAADNWLVTQLSGDARVVHAGAQPASLKVNGQLSPGDTLMTGATGRATLVRGADYIVVAPHSELRLPSAPQPSGFTRVMQNLGTMLFKVQHTAIPHFAVDTPMLAAVVKGTTFTVVVDEHRSAVQVIQGRVQVSAIDGGMSRMVEGGRTVFVNHANPSMLLDADKPVPATSAPSSTSVKVSAAGNSPFGAIASLTGGLVRAELAPGPSIAVAATPTVVPLVSTALTTSSPSTATNPPPAGGSPGTTTIATATPVATVPSTPTPAIIVASTNATAAGTPGATVPGTTTTVTVPSAVPAVTVATNVTVTAPAAAVPGTTAPTVTVQPPTAPVVTAANVTVPAAPAPTVTVGSNSGPGSLSSGSGSSNSGPGSVTSGSGSNSGPGSLTSGSGSNSGTGSVSSGGDPLIAISTPTVTVPSITTPIIPVTTPTITVPSIDVTVGTSPAPAPLISIPKITIGSLNL